LICSHISELISSRTWPAFSRAAITQAATEVRFEGVEQRVVQPRQRAGDAGGGQSEAAVQPFDRGRLDSGRPVEAEIHGDVDEARRVFRALEIAADPVERVSYA
jgi:hypothetical protein